MTPASALTPSSGRASTTASPANTNAPSKLRQGAEPRSEHITGVLESINGIAAGFKNTG
jgi:hypothetical protein